MGARRRPSERANGTVIGGDRAHQEVSGARTGIGRVGRSISTEARRPWPQTWQRSMSMPVRRSRRARAVGEEAEVPNADEALGDAVEEEAADELLGAQGHDRDAVAVGVVLPAKAHDTGLEVDEALVALEGDVIQEAERIR